VRHNAAFGLRSPQVTRERHRHLSTSTACVTQVSTVTPWRGQAQISALVALV
jgi:hypothetical protein